ncbi:TetR/AcrR family transcriptional regulator [Nocardia sp. NPDC059246]|uniref:TetR/AcrR family transcriptional regulator n=1 Tax=unclassified Nocardia TaxID=2637762 RepID=UPI0036C05C6B
MSVTREDYFEAAMHILATEGHRALKMSTLCKHLGITTGSFYNYFGNWASFVPALLTHWEVERTARIVELSSRPVDPGGRIRLLKELTVQIPHDAEAAIRARSNGDPVVAEFQRRVDEARFEALRNTVRGRVHDEARAESLSIMGMSLLIGIQSWRSPVDTGELQRLFDDYEAIINSCADNADH